MSDLIVLQSSPAATYLEIIRGLIEEMNSSIDAISRNALSEFELSLWNQEMACAALKGLLRHTKRIPDRETRLLLRKELASMKAVAQKYEGVVQRGSAATALLMDLCSLHAAAAQGSSRSSISWEA